MPHDSDALFTSTRRSRSADRLADRHQEKATAAMRSTGDVATRQIPPYIRDLSHPHAPRTVPGILVAALRQAATLQ